MNEQINEKQVQFYPESAMVIMRRDKEETDLIATFTFRWFSKSNDIYTVEHEHVFHPTSDEEYDKIRPEFEDFIHQFSSWVEPENHPDFVKAVGGNQYIFLCNPSVFNNEVI